MPYWMSDRKSRVPYIPWKALRESRKMSASAQLRHENDLIEYKGRDRLDEIRENNKQARKQSRKIEKEKKKGSS